MKRLIILLIFCLTPFLGKASHIVGGELALVHIPGTLYRYRVEMILYYDVHGNTGGDLTATVRIFSKLNNAIMRDIILNAEGPSNTSNPSNIFAIGTPVEYYQPECSEGSIETNRVFYTSNEFELSPSIFSDPEGYYMVYERCCRNYTIKNIYSETPNPANLDRVAGQIFYLEFPPVTIGGEAFINSSPRLFPPLSDYACPGYPYFVDFAGSDADGDSLVYSMVTPLNSVERLNALPPGGPNHGPYDSISWKPDFNNKNFMNGSPDLAISSEGLLTVTPTSAGLYVFAVRCSEYRNGVKIGEVRRDFQLFVSDVCKTAVPPVITGRKLLDKEFTYKDNMTINFPYTTADIDRCIEVQVYDPDIHNAFDNFQEKIKIRTRGINGSGKEVSLPAIKNATLNETDSTAKFKICFDKCPPNYNTPYQIQIIAYDDACALPLLDTLRITVNVETPPNGRAQFVNPSGDVVASLKEGDPKALWPLKVVDPDGDLLTISYFTDGFNLADVGMDFDFTQPIQGIVEDTLIWDPSCDKYNFSVKRNFNITIIADDNDLCSYNIADTVHFNLTLIPPPNADPVIDVDITPVYSERFVDGGAHRIFEEIEFTVFGHDDDVGYPISLEAIGSSFNLADYGMNFPEASGSNNISSYFTWPLECPVFDLKQKHLFDIRFLVIDKNNKCKIYQADTVDVSFDILPPLNTAPELTLTNLNPETTVAINEAESYWGQSIEYLVNGIDDDKNPVVDNITITLVEVKGSYKSATGEVKEISVDGYSFNSVTGQESIESKFIWTPDCSVFAEFGAINDYKFKFKLSDDHCESAVDTTKILTLHVRDHVNEGYEFLPYNIITSNGDDYNAYFALDGLPIKDGQKSPNIPPDNCINKFEYINIYNRWGKLVFTSDNRFFKWYALNEGAGVYYYYIKYTEDNYKGSVLIRH